MQTNCKVPLGSGHYLCGVALGLGNAMLDIKYDNWMSHVAIHPKYGES